MATAHATSGAASRTGNLDYNGGPVLHSSAPYLIFWTPTGESMPTGSEPLLERYFTDVAADSGKATNVYAVGRQFTDPTGFADYQQAFSSSSQAIVDVHGYPPLDSANCQDTGEPTCLTDAQLQTEVQRLIETDRLPDDGSATGAELAQNAPIYFVVLPSDVNVCSGGGQPTTCSDNTFCAYHSAFTDSGNDSVLYAVIPTVLAVSNPKSCQSDGNSAVQEPNGNVADVVLSYLSHEDNETITDPLGTGWWSSASGNEDGDNCSFSGSFNPNRDSNPNAFLPTLGGSATAGTLYDQVINGDRYYTQSEWSNGDGNCELQPTAGAITPAFSGGGPNVASSPMTFDPTPTTSTNAISSATWDFGDGTAPLFQGGSPTFVYHTYSALGTYVVTLTIVDDRGNLRSTTQQVSIYALPTAAFTFGPSDPLERTSVHFDASSSSDPDPGGVASYSWNFGDGNSGSGETASHTYSSHGTYTVTLTVSNAGGLTNSSSWQVTVREEDPTPSFTVPSGPHAIGVAVAFDGSGSDDPDGSIDTYAWSFGDGAVGAGPTATHTYRAPGTYSVSVTVTDSSGLSSTETQHLVVVRGSRITGISYVARRHRDYLVIKVDGPGTLVVGGRQFAIGGSGTLTTRLRLSAAQRRTLRRIGHLKVRIPVSYAPAVGVPSSTVVKLTLRG